MLGPREGRLVGLLDQNPVRIGPARSRAATPGRRVPRDGSPAVDDRPRIGGVLQETGDVVAGGGAHWIDRRPSVTILVRPSRPVRTSSASPRQTGTVSPWPRSHRTTARTPPQARPSLQDQAHTIAHLRVTRDPELPIPRIRLRDVGDLLVPWRHGPVDVRPPRLLGLPVVVQALDDVRPVPAGDEPWSPRRSWSEESAGSRSSPG